MIEVGKSYRAGNGIVVTVLAVNGPYAWVYNTGGVNTSPYTLHVNGMEDWPEYVEPVVETRWADIRLVKAGWVHSQWSTVRIKYHNVQGTFTGGELTKIELVK